MNFEGLKQSKLDYKTYYGYDFKYVVSNAGDVYGRANKKRIARINGYGYVSMCAYKNKKTTSFLVHRLVAELFIPNPENKPCVNHKDGNKHNNRVDNLEWCTYSENTLHAYRTGLQKSSLIKNKNTSKHKLVLSKNTGIYYESVKDAAKYNNIKRPTLSMMLTGKRRNKTDLVLC